MFFYLSKIFWILFNPVNFIVILLFIGIVLHFFRIKIYKKIYKITFFLFIFIAILPTGTYLLWKLENVYTKPKILPDEIEGVMILGAGINESYTYQHKQIILNDQIERITISIDLMKKFPNAKIIFSGGNGTLSNLPVKGSVIAKKFYDLMGVDVNRIKFEDKSRNTYENFLFSKKFFDKKNNNNWLLITSAYHMKRSMSVAEKLDLNFIPYPVDFRTGKNFSWRFWYHRTNFLQNMNDFQLAAHEYIGLVAYYLTKKSSKIF